MRLQSFCSPYAIFLLLWLSTPLLANVPTFWFETAAPTEWSDRVHLAFRDCVEIARLAALSFQGTCDPVYERYFEEGEDIATFVKRVFETIANIKDASVIDAATGSQIMRSDEVVNCQPKFSKLVVALDEPPGTPDKYKGYCSTKHGGAAAWDDQGRWVAMLCPAVLAYPTIDEIRKAGPVWKYDDQGKPKPGWSCDGLLDRDTEFMLTPGAWLLHELIHWRGLLEDIPDFFSFIFLSQTAEYLVSDFTGPQPPNGYGTWNSQLLKKRAVSNPDDFKSRPWPTLNNADNYVWYAVSKYWAWRCQKTFNEAQSNEDDFLRRNEGGVTLAGIPALTPSDQYGDQAAGIADDTSQGDPPSSSQS